MPTTAGYRLAVEIGGCAITLDEARLCVLRFVASSPDGEWVSLFRIDHLRRLAPDDLAVVPGLVGSGLIEHDPDGGRIRITENGRAILGR